MPRLDEERLRRFRTAQRAGDEAGARRHWADLLTDNFDRIRGFVGAESWGRLSPDEQEEAVQKALIKIANDMIATFRGTTMGEWVQCCRTLVHFTCIDVQRRAQAVSRRERSLDQPAPGDDDELARLDKDVYAAIERTRHAEEDELQRAEVLAERQGFLDWAVSQLAAKRRAVIELDRADVPVDEIQRQLGASRDAVYQSRHRGLEDLIRLRQDYEEES